MKSHGYGQAKVLTKEEIDLIFNKGFTIGYGCRTKRNRALFGVCLYTGVRINEACTLYTEDVYLNRRKVKSVITVRSFNTKGNRGTRNIPVNKELKVLLENYLPGEIRVFPNVSKNNKKGCITPRTADYILRTACINAGIFGVSTHSFRRTCLTKLHKSNVPLRVIQKISGHSSLASLQRYLEVDESDLLNAISELDFT